MKLAAAIAFALVLTSADAYAVRADQIDYLVHYNNQNQYDRDTLPGKHSVTADGVSALNPGHAMIVQAWRPSQDHTDIDGTVTHNYLPGIWVLISVPNGDADADADADTYLVFNRKKCNARAVGCLKARNPNAPPTQDVRYEPVYMGADVPWGSVQ